MSDTATVEITSLALNPMTDPPCVGRYAVMLVGLLRVPPLQTWWRLPISDRGPSPTVGTWEFLGCHLGLGFLPTHVRFPPVQIRPDPSGSMTRGCSPTPISWPKEPTARRRGRMGA